MVDGKYNFIFKQNHIRMYIELPFLLMGIFIQESYSTRVGDNKEEKTTITEQKTQAENLTYVAIDISALIYFLKF